MEKDIQKQEAEIGPNDQVLCLEDCDDFAEEECSHHQPSPQIMNTRWVDYLYLSWRHNLLLAVEVAIVSCEL